MDTSFKDLKIYKILLKWPNTKYFDRNLNSWIGLTMNHTKFDFQRIKMILQNLFWCVSSVVTLKGLLNGEI